MAFSIDSLDLSMRDPETGNIVTANIYRGPASSGTFPCSSS